MDLNEIIQSVRSAMSRPTDDDLRSLPHKQAFIYGRVSSQGQVRESEESIREIATLVRLSKKDGYRTNLEPDQVDRWLDTIQAGSNVERVIADGEVTVDCRDLGLSGTLGEDKRPGLANLRHKVDSGEVGTVYLTEGMSRLSRDRDRVLGYQLLKLLKERQCRVRTPEGVYNPAIPRDWDYLAEDIADSADELRKLGVRLGRRRAAKAAAGEHVGSPVCPGYIVGVEGRRRDGSYVFGKWQPYDPHRQVVVEALQEMVRQGSLLKTVKALRDRSVVFPFFPEELSYMETRSALRLYHKDNTGYVITYNALKGLATNLKLIGTWQWRDILIDANHEAAVPVGLFLQAFEIAKSKHPKGRAAYPEPMEWSGLLYCYKHDEPRRLTALNATRRWSCRCDYYLPRGSPCIQIADHILTGPLTKAFLDCLDLTPHAEAVLEKLKSEVNRDSLEERQLRRQEAELQRQIANLERFLGTSDDPEREKTYWRLIDEKKRQLELVRPKPAIPSATPPDLEEVAKFLENLDREWARYPSRLRNRLLTLLVDRVEVRHHGSNIEATIVWKLGFHQVVKITRPPANYTRNKVWRAEEDKLLAMLWPSASPETLLAAFPNRTLLGLNKRASYLKLKRQWVRQRNGQGRRWTKEERQKLGDLYSSGARAKDIARALGRSRGAVIAAAHVMGVSRPEDVKHRRLEPHWETLNVKLLQESSILYQ